MPSTDGSVDLARQAASERYSLVARRFRRVRQRRFLTNHYHPRSYVGREIDTFPQPMHADADILNLQMQLAEICSALPKRYDRSYVQVQKLELSTFTDHYREIDPGAGYTHTKGTKGTTISLNLP